MVISPNGDQFIVDVKGLYKRNWWLITPKAKKRKNLFYILALVPDDESNQFFILSQQEVDSEFRRYVKEKSAERISKGLSAEKVGLFPGISSTAANKFKDQWDKLPK